MAEANVIADSATFVKTLGDIRDTALVTVVIIVVVVAFVISLYLYLRSKDNRARDRRANAHVDVVAKLSDSIQETTNTHVRTNAATLTALNNLASKFGSLESTVSLVRSLVSDLLISQDKRLSPEQSLQVIKVFHDSVIPIRISELFAFSLTENDYASRKEYIKDRMRTEMGRFLYEMRNELRKLPLSVKVDLFFPVETGQRVERLILCNQMWDAVVQLYVEVNRPLDERIDEMRLQVRNLAKDHFDSCAGEFAAQTPVPYSNQAHRTPLPQQ